MIGQITLAWVYGHVLEYVLHRFVLHNRKILSGKPFKKHFSGHHGRIRKGGMLDPDYNQWKKYSFLDSEPLVLFLLTLVHLPVAIYFPYAYVVLLLSGALYFVVHALTHVAPKIMAHVIPWHSWHHLNKDQNMNYGVRLPIIDIVAGTYKPPASMLR